MQIELAEREVLGIGFTTGSLEEVAQHILNIREPTCQYIVTPNVDFVVRYHKHAEFKEIVDQAAIRTADGMPVVLAARLKGVTDLQRVTGADLLPEICSQAAATGTGIFFLGGMQGVASAAADKLVEANPGLVISGTYSPPFGFESDPLENARIIEAINSSGAEIIFIGLGSPKQEKWIITHREKLNCRVALCTGAAFDFVAGQVNRAPAWIQRLGFEWLWRLCSEPKRLWRRYLVEDSYFAIILFRYLFGRS